MYDLRDLHMICKMTSLFQISSEVTPELVQVLLRPLQRPGALEKTLEILSYSTGPLLEQLLSDRRLSGRPVWLCWGRQDPWTPTRRVSALQELGVERLVELPEVGHCPHDEAPEKVTELIAELVKRCEKRVRHGTYDIL